MFRSFAFLMERESRLIELQLAGELPRQIFLSRCLRQRNRLLGTRYGVTKTPSLGIGGGKRMENDGILSAVS